MVRHDIGNRLFGGQDNMGGGGGVHIYIMWTLQYMHDNLFKGQFLLGAAHKVVPVNYDRRKDGRMTQKHNVPPVILRGIHAYIISIFWRSWVPVCGIQGLQNLKTGNPRTFIIMYYGTGR